MANKITAALTSVTQETTVALANLNFDFALFKVEAPQEYSGVGQYLSKKRRDAAENGKEHIIARRLGALFGQALPATPTLIKAYGTRCSEIAKEAAAKQKYVRSKTLFDDWIGADATSIWAAATSGKGAIAVHLLACMLARIWTAHEATAIWEELIENRKADLGTADSADPMDISSLAASRIEITRDQISRWDASARAWISVADGVKKKQQTQLMLLMSNLSLPISKGGGVYDSVMSAWKGAMEIMEKVLNHTSQSVQDGAGLVGLASWHLYPDIYALRAVVKTVKFNDPLVPSDVLVTLGAGHSSSTDDTSVHWSLPLACLRYYGDPVPSSTTMAVTSSRLSMLECWFVILGSTMSTWGDLTQDLDSACKFIIALSDYVVFGVSPQLRRETTWLQHLSHAAQEFLTSREPERDMFQKLIARGSRRYAHFLAPLEGHPGGMFGLDSVRTLISMIKHPDNKVAVLRRIAEKRGELNSNLLIRYPRPEPQKQPLADSWDEMPLGDESDFLADFVLSTDYDRPTDALDLLSEAAQMTDTEKRLKADKHADHMSFSEDKPKNTDNFSVSLSKNASVSSTYLSSDVRQEPVDLRGQMKREKKSLDWEFATALAKQPSKKRKLDPQTDMTGHTRWVEEMRHIDNGELVKVLDNISIVESGPDKFVWIEDMTQEEQEHTGSLTYKTSYKCVLGDQSDAAMFIPNANFTTPWKDNSVEVDTLLLAFRCSWIDHAMLVEHLNNFNNPGHSTNHLLQYRTSLWNMAAAANIYKLMPHATINPSIFTRTLANASWAVTAEQSAPPRAFDFRLREWTTTLRDERKSLHTVTLTREQTMACIAHFENAQTDLDPNILKDAMALSCGNSIYVSAALMCDPYECPRDYEIKHVMGNIGRPGLSLMIPPMDPRTRKQDESTWAHVDHHDFDGRFEDCYQHTSLHLNFTGYQLPVGGLSHGRTITDAFFVESVVSVYDRSAWVADLDILKGLASQQLQRWPLVLCSHQDSACHSFPLTSIDSWDEYLDPPLNFGIFRGNGNWLARLAVVAHNALHQRETVLFKDADSVCWGCVSIFLATRKGSPMTTKTPEKSKPLFVC
ncbi:uncharacterized protein K489DRAFT_384767 [Dissoconium aciculare CBS 342.82]|uniref:Uncharacterized protein n=1 Tax=Dissoconium aciculare CBS 342.82 TaxID=1314786 RepID=A0A6J3LTH2_9PEZI|nr:uncharacterized protein K489DRAFT_384767 [Dissoconium aciculare CBS 342.82]KAF1818579.1 hypothetical protein K489DRAFT_384767 [Dissoconium aciculare CBS 342.82]